MQEASKVRSLYMSLLGFPDRVIVYPPTDPAATRAAKRHFDWLIAERHYRQRLQRRRIPGGETRLNAGGIPRSHCSVASSSRRSISEARASPGDKCVNAHVRRPALETSTLGARIQNPERERLGGRPLAETYAHDLSSVDDASSAVVTKGGDAESSHGSLAI